MILKTECLDITHDDELYHDFIWKIGEKVPNIPKCREVIELFIDGKKELDTLRSLWDKYPIIHGIFLGASVRIHRTTALFNEDAAQIIFEILIKEYGQEC